MKILHWLKSGGSLILLCPRVTSQMEKQSEVCAYILRFCFLNTQWCGPGRLGGLVAHPWEEGRVCCHLQRQRRAEDGYFNGLLVGFVWKQVRTAFAGISVMSGSLRSSKKGHPPHTVSQGPRPRGSWSEVQTTSEAAGATSVQISTAAPRFHSRRKGPKRKPAPRQPSPLLQNRPCWSAGLLAWNCWLTEPCIPGTLPSPATKCLASSVSNLFSFSSTVLCSNRMRFRGFSFFFFWKVVYCTWNFEVIGWEQIQRILDAGLWRPKERNGESLLFFCFLKSQDTETHSLNQSLGQECYGRYEELGHCSF